MTAGTGAAVRHRPPRPVRFSPAAAGRLLRLELRRNAMIWVLPLLALLFWLDTYQRSTLVPPLWTVRSMAMQWRAMFEFLPFAAGVAAWMGSREGRRRITDLAGVTARPRWSRQFATWTATTCWALGVYLGCSAVLFGVTAARATWGGPLWWPLAVGATCITAATALGFAAGTLLPSRFTPPMAVVVILVLLVVVSPVVTGRYETYGRLSPLPTNTLGSSLGIFYPFIPDISIVQMMFYGGIAVALLGALGLPASSGGRWLRGVAAVVTVAGLAAVGTGYGLAGTSYATASGVVVPDLHDAASDRAIPHTPACSRGGSAVPVCLHPAFSSYLPALTAALEPLLSEVAGLPGAPVRVTQAAGPGQSPVPVVGGKGFPEGIISGSPPVLYLDVLVPIDTNSYTTADFTGPAQWQAATAILQSVVGVSAAGSGAPGGKPGAGSPVGTPAQQAVAAALVKAAGNSLAAPDGQGQGREGPGPSIDQLMPPAGSSADAAAQRFAALPAASRHAWLATHLTALRAGHVTLAQIP
jgi:hypothetical protein